jgi:hypothetical protein
VTGVDRARARGYHSRMQVHQTAYDRFTVALPRTEAPYALADREVAAEIAGWLWDFGPTPVMALVELTSAQPEWLGAWRSASVRWRQGSAAAVVFAARDDLERFLAAGAPHEGTTLVWPRRGPAKTFEALAAGGEAWLQSVEAYARVERDGELVEVVQQP